MKTLLALFLAVPLLASAQTNELTVVSNSIWGATELAFKAGVATGYAYSAFRRSTNSAALDSREKGFLLMGECWNDFTNHTVKTRPYVSTSTVTNITPIIEYTNYSSRDSVMRRTPPETIKWLESPLTVPIYNYHTNGYETESLFGSYRHIDAKIQIGMRSDGVVIWRERPEATATDSDTPSNR